MDASGVVLAPATVSASASAARRLGVHGAASVGGVRWPPRRTRDAVAAREAPPREDRRQARLRAYACVASPAQALGRAVHQGGVVDDARRTTLKLTAPKGMRVRVVVVRKKR